MEFGIVNETSKMGIHWAEKDILRHHHRFDLSNLYHSLTRLSVDFDKEQR